MIEEGDKITVDGSFELTEREKRFFQDLSDWQERSKNTHWVLGEPLEY